MAGRGKGKTVNSAARDCARGEETVTGGYRSIEDVFVERYLRREGESLEEAKKRLKQQYESRGK